MSTFGQAIQQILTDINRGAAHSARVRVAIVDAIGYYRTKRFGFNTATASLSWSTSDRQALPGDWLATDRARLIHPTYRYVLLPVTSDELDDLEREAAGSAPAAPCRLAIQDRLIRIHPYPDADYQVAFTYLKDLPEVSLSANDSATNAWVTEAWPLIKARALVDLWENYIGGEESAGKSDRNREREREWLSNLQSAATGEKAPARLSGYL